MSSILLYVVGLNPCIASFFMYSDPVNLMLSKRGNYVVLSALCLAWAYESGEYRKIRQVVSTMKVPQTFASQILAELVRAQLATSKAGKDGGYLLTRPPAEITMLEIIEAGEGTLRAQRCALKDGPCQWDFVCPLHWIWGDAIAAFRDTLANVTLADFVANDKALQQNTFLMPSESHRPGAKHLIEQ
ncbi:MAG TPA: Rrf2 family transcriptional regulator [Candidatus Nanopelagicaceae bacterium]